MNWGDVASWAEKAKKAVVEQAQGAMEELQKGSVADDLELGGDAGGSDVWKNWTQSAVAAAGGVGDSLKQGWQRASTSDWSEQAKNWQGDFATRIGKASEVAAKAGAGLAENAKLAQQKASVVAGSAGESLRSAGTSMGSGLASFGSLAASPAKLIQAAGIFMFGMMLLSLSFSFLPLLPINPAKFALLFALGSVTMLGSVVWLKGPQSFAAVALQRDKLPFTVSYGFGLIGTFYATLIARSYIFTAVFAILQAVGLLYFLASFIPGGRAVLNFFGRLGGRASSMLLPR
mmetsp:Transcript_75140/g.163930  ORF Transcript_75140/g.163930 Transcript_75140/m.163930 type:complete len:289 (-) Transcript_75140:113-979(-)